MVEPAARLPIGMIHGAKRYSTLLIALKSTTRMHGFHTSGTRERTLPARGLLVGQSLAGLLDIHTGDTVEIDIPGTGVHLREQIAGFVDEPFGAVAYMSLSRLASLAGQPVVTAAYLRLVPGAERLAVRTKVSQVPGVTSYTDVHAVYQSIRSQMNLFYAFVAIMLVFGGLLAVALCLNAMTANVTERNGEIAALRVAGMPRRTLWRLISTENLTVAAIGLPLGIISGIILGRAMLDTYTSDIYRWPLQLHWWTPVVVAALIFVAATLAQLPALRAASRIDLGRVVRERSL